MKNETSIKVPKKYHKMIEEIYHDSDGYWCHTEKGYYAAGMDNECHTIHEDTHAYVLAQIRQIKSGCTCKECNS